MYTFVVQEKKLTICPGGCGANNSHPWECSGSLEDFLGVSFRFILSSVLLMLLGGGIEKKFRTLSAAKEEEGPK